MNDNARLVIALFLVFLAFSYKPKPKNNLVPPDPAVIKVVEKLPQIESGEDAARIAGVFEAIAHNFPSTIISSYQLQNFLAEVGTKATGGAVAGKYRDFSKKVSEVIISIAGPQNGSQKLSGAQRKQLANFFHGIAHRLLDSKYEAVFQETKKKAEKAIEDYNSSVPDDDTPTKCECGGTGYITHGDGHKTPCPCEDCDCAKTQVGSKPHNCQCVAPGYECACEDEYGRCDCPPVSTEQVSATAECSGSS